MSLLTGITVALLSAAQIAPPPATSSDTVGAAIVPPAGDPAGGPARGALVDAPATTSAEIPTLLALRPAGLAWADRARFDRAPHMAERDTVPRRRPKAVVYSDFYGTRVRIHKALSWTMLPLFAVSYLTGDQLLRQGSDAPRPARLIHPIAATGTAVLFGANAITGSWNLWESRRDPNGRVRRYVHSLLFMAASGGFAYTGTVLANEAQESQARRTMHRNVALASVGTSTASWLLMLVRN